MFGRCLGSLRACVLAMHHRGRGESSVTRISYFYGGRVVSVIDCVWATELDRCPVTNVGHIQHVYYFVHLLSQDDYCKFEKAQEE